MGSIMSDHPRVMKRYAVLSAVADAPDGATVKGIAGYCESVGVPLWLRSIRRFLAAEVKDGNVESGGKPAKYSLTAEGAVALKWIGGEVDALPKADKKRQTTDANPAGGRKKKWDPSEAPDNVVDLGAYKASDPAPPKKKRKAKPKERQGLRVALALKQEVFEGKVTPREAIDRLAKDLPSLADQEVTDLWEQAWWHGVDPKDGEWKVYQGRTRAGPGVRDGEGKLVRKSKWYYSPPGCDGVYSGAHNSRRDAHAKMVEARDKAAG